MRWKLISLLCATTALAAACSSTPQLPDSGALDAPAAADVTGADTLVTIDIPDTGDADTGDTGDADTGEVTDVAADGTLCAAVTDLLESHQALELPELSDSDGYVKLVDQIINGWEKLYPLAPSNSAELVVASEEFFSGLRDRLDAESWDETTAEEALGGGPAGYVARLYCGLME